MSCKGDGGGYVRHVFMCGCLVGQGLGPGGTYGTHEMLSQTSWQDHREREGIKAVGLSKTSHKKIKIKNNSLTSKNIN